ncbi:nitrate transporter 1:2, partial [Medicago truncatula]
ITLNSRLAELPAFSVQQSATMNTMLGSFKVLFIDILATPYNNVIVQFARK